MNTILALVPALLISTSTVAAPPLGGSEEAAFDASVLRQLLDEEGCAGLRFYNSTPAQGSGGTIMVIGIRADGTELTGGKQTPYAANGGTTANPAAAQWWSKSDASQACARVAAGGQTSFSASVSAADARALLDLEGCTGIGVSATGSGFKISAYATADGRMRKMGDGEGFEKNSGDPCPLACGSPTNYVNQALLNK